MKGSLGDVRWTECYLSVTTYPNGVVYFSLMQTYAMRYLKPKAGFVEGLFEILTTPTTSFASRSTASLNP